MDNFDKRQAVMVELLREPGRSDRLIAEKVGLSPSLVRKVRRKLELEGRLEPGKRVGRDGRRRGKPYQGEAHTTPEGHRASEDELVKWGLVDALMLMGYTEKEAIEIAEKRFGEVEEKDRQFLIEQGKMYLARRQSSGHENADRRDKKA